MKKWMALLLCIVMLLSMAACGGNGDHRKDEDDKEDTVQRDPQSTGGKEDPADPEQGADSVDDGKITAQKLMELPENPETDFEYTPMGDTECRVTKYVGSSDIVVMPQTLGGRTVV